MAHFVANRCHTPSWVEREERQKAEPTHDGREQLEASEEAFKAGARWLARVLQDAAPYSVRHEMKLLLGEG
jgi:hypothetical protein